jgi:hypothetical protein
MRAAFRAEYLLTMIAAFGSLNINLRRAGKKFEVLLFAGGRNAKSRGRECLAIGTMANPYAIRINLCFKFQMPTMAGTINFHSFCPLCSL